MLAVIHRASGLVLKACCFGIAVIKVSWKEKDKAGITNCLEYAAVVLDDGGFSEVSV